MNYIANPLTRVSVRQGLENKDWDLKMWTPHCPWLLHINCLLSGSMPCSKNVMQINDDLQITEVYSVDRLVTSHLFLERR